jgi:hypothetical protein
VRISKGGALLRFRVLDCLDMEGVGPRRVRKEVKGGAPLKRGAHNKCQVKQMANELKGGEV